MEDSSHTDSHSKNAFCDNAGPQELRHLQTLLDQLTDSEVANLVDQLGITFDSPTSEIDRDTLEGVVDEADREVFYEKYHATVAARG